MTIGLLSLDQVDGEFWRSDVLFSIYIRTTMDCTSKNVIYAMICRGCQEIYIGSTGNELRRRMTTHRQQIRVPETQQLWASEHISKCANVEPKFYVCPLLTSLHTEMGE